MKKLLMSLILIHVSTIQCCCNVFAQDPLQSHKYDFVYEKEARNVRMELNNKIAMLANNELDPVINKAIMVWRGDGDKEKFNRATEVALKNYRAECGKAQKHFEKRMCWAEKNLHANSQEEVLKVGMKVATREIKNLMRNFVN